MSLDGGLEFGDNLAFNAKVKGSQIGLGNLLQNEALGSLSFKLDVDGSGSTLNDLDATVNAQIDSLDFNNYSFKDLNLTAVKNCAGLVLDSRSRSRIRFLILSEVVSGFTKAVTSRSPN